MPTVRRSTVNGQTAYPSEALNENQRELNHFAIVSWQHSQGRFRRADFRDRSLLELELHVLIRLGDLLFNGIAQDAYKQNVAYALQSDAAYRLTDTHTAARAASSCRAITPRALRAAQVIALDPTTGIQTSDVPTTIIDNGAKTEWIESVYLQDEWKVIPPLTFNYGLRFDKFTAYHGGSPGKSPRQRRVAGVGRHHGTYRLLAVSYRRRPLNWWATRPWRSS